MSDGEIWKPIARAPGYEVSNYGWIRNRKTGRILKDHPGGYGSRRCCLMVGGNKKHIDIAQCVLEAFVGPRPDGLECCHWDDNKRNNHVTNLRWDTHSNNMKDIKRNKQKAVVL